MARPTKQLSVTPEMRRKWLQRHEENGESAPQIAKKDGYDVRTVRKQLDLARQDRERRETRLVVLRDAMQSHYSDLCRRVAEIESALDRKSPGNIGMEDRMGAALREHLRRAPLWKNLDRWNSLQETLQQIKSNIDTRLEEEVRSDSGLKNAFSGGKMDVDGLVKVMAHQLDTGASGSPGLNVEDYFRTESTEGGPANFRYGAWFVGTGEAVQASRVKDALADFEKKIFALREYQELSETQQRLDGLKEDILEELATITLRRVVPGRCRYCPI